MLQRSSGEPTLIFFLDPIQFMIPTPKTSKNIEDLDKDRCRQILKDLVSGTSMKLKINEDSLKLKLKR